MEASLRWRPIFVGGQRHRREALLRRINSEASPEEELLDLQRATHREPTQGSYQRAYMIPVIAEELSG